MFFCVFFLILSINHVISQSRQAWQPRPDAEWQATRGQVFPAPLNETLRWGRSEDLVSGAEMPAAQRGAQGELGWCSEGPAAWPPSLSPVGTRGGVHTRRGHAAAQGNTQRRQRTELPLRPLRRPDAPVTGAGAWRRGLRPHARVRGPTARVWGRPPPARRTCCGFQPCFCEAFCLGLNRLRKPAIWSHLRWLISSFSSKS